MSAKHSGTETEQLVPHHQHSTSEPEDQNVSLELIGIFVLFRRPSFVSGSGLFFQLLSFLILK